MKRKLNALVIGCMLGSAVLFCHSQASAAKPDPWPKDKKDSYDLTGQDVTSTFKKYMKCNEGKLSNNACASDFASPEFYFNYEVVQSLRNYHVIMLPGGEFDFLDELLGYCGEGKQSYDVEGLFQSFPRIEQQIEKVFNEEVCPAYERDPETYYDEFFDGFIAYEQFLGSNDISFTRLQFSKDDDPHFAGDRPDKISLLADTIDKIEAQQAGDNSSKDFILLGHSFGGINIADFLVELLNAHVPGTPEHLMFADTKVRSWPADKKERIFKKIKGIALINTFVQGERTAETSLRQVAKDQNLQVDDPIEFYINRVLQSHQSELFSTDNISLHTIYAGVTLSNRYRVNYFLKDKNMAAPGAATPIKDAFDRIASDMAVVSVGTWVPKHFQFALAGPNVLVALSKTKWRQENIKNDGMVDSFASIIPRAGVEYVILPNLDHGALVLKPMIPGISSGHHYNQTPFIKTLFTRLSTRIEEMNK